MNYFVSDVQAIPGSGDNTRSAALIGGDSEQEIAVWVLYMRLFFLLTPVKALPVCGLDSGWEGVCTRVEGSSLNMEYGSATRGVFISAIYIQIKNTDIVNAAEGYLGPRAVSCIGTVLLLRTALRVITHKQFIENWDFRNVYAQFINML